MRPPQTLLIRADLIMDCAEVKNHMEQFLNGSLGGYQARRVRAHMASCSHCASSLTENDRIEALASRDEVIEPSQTRPKADGAANSRDKTVAWAPFLSGSQPGSALTRP